MPDRFREPDEPVCSCGVELLDFGGEDVCPDCYGPVECDGCDAVGTAWDMHKNGDRRGEVACPACMEKEE